VPKMLRFQIPASVAFVALTLLAMAAGPKNLVWQAGEIVSMKEEVSDRDGDHTSYVYGVKGKDRTFAVVIPTPLKAYIHSKIKFALDRNLLYIQDLDGKLRKTCVIEPSETAPHE
jgi:hypothetical protein